MKLSVQKLQLKRGTDQFDAYFENTTQEFESSDKGTTFFIYLKKK